MSLHKLGDHMLCGKNYVQDITVEGTMYYLRQDDPFSKLDIIDISEIPPFSSLHVTGDLYSAPDCEMTIHGTKNVICISMADCAKNK